MSTLPPKEQSLYKRLMKCYDQQQYKMGLKFAKQILANSKCVDHGETLAMKGLFLGLLGKKEEGYDCVRGALKNNLKSSICWHAYGFLQRLDNKFDEAVKCYRNCLKLDKDNIQIIRDVSFLQIQTRDLDGFRESSYQLFQLRPTQRRSWLGFIVACHLSKLYDLGLEVLRAMSKVDLNEYELSELCLYENMLLRESGRSEQALEHLLNNQKNICDQNTVDMWLSGLYLSLNKNDEAVSRLEGVIERNGDYLECYQLLFEAHRLVEDHQIAGFLKNLPNPSSLAKRLILNYLTGDEFSEYAQNYMKNGLRKGVPTLFVLMKSLYSDPLKKESILYIMLSFKKNIQMYSSFTKDGEKEAESTILWIYLFLAQHYDYVGDPRCALDYIEEAIEHTPTLVELYMVKAKIYKHAGDIVEACRWIDEAQSMDTADRYINSKCAKYFLQAGLIDEAEQMCSHFTTDGVPIASHLTDIQCIWFLIGCARAYETKNKYGEALKKCHQINNYFTQIEDDQFDFHSYCLRKLTLRTYVDFLRMEDTVRRHKFYKIAACLAISIYLKLHDRPSESKEEDEIDANLTPSELKKIKNKRRKAKLRQAQEAPPEKREVKKAGDPENAKKYIDPEELVQVKEPLVEAVKFLKGLQLFAPDIDTHLLAFEIYKRSGKPLLMLQSIKRAWKVDSAHPKLHLALITYLTQVAAWKESKSVSNTVISVIDQVLEPLVAGLSPLQLNTKFLQSHGNTLPHLLQGSIALATLDPSKRSQAIATATRLDITGLSIENCADVLNALLDGSFGEVGPAEEYKTKCRLLFPFATCFQSKSDRVEAFKDYLARGKNSVHEHSPDRSA